MPRIIKPELFSVEVPSAGPTPCDLAFVGQGPGYEEVKSNPPTPFIGPAGREFNEVYLRRYTGISRDCVWVGNLYNKFIVDKNGKDRKPTREEILTHWPSLQTELFLVAPKILVTLGESSTRWFMDQAELDYTDMYTLNGVPPGFWNNALIFPILHPAAGVHSTDEMALIASGFQSLAEAISLLRNRGDWALAELVPGDEYEGIESYTHGDGSISDADSIGVFIDTEGSREDPIFLTYSVKFGESRIIYDDEKDSLTLFNAGVNAGNYPVWLHHGLHDLPILEAMGVRVPPERVIDTMLLAHLLANQPLGLKALAWRIAGMKMQSYDEVIGDAGKAKAIDYLMRILGREWPKPETRVVLKKSVYRLKTPQPIERRITNILRDVDTGKIDKDGNPTDPHIRWNKVEPELRAPVERALGKMPVATLRDIDLAKASSYACLSCDSRVQTELGNKRIETLVKGHLPVKVKCLSSSGRVELKRIINWYRIKYPNTIKWLSIKTKHTRIGRWGHTGTRYTPDHRVLTERGFIAVESLIPTDKIAMPIEALSSIQRQVALGSLLGDGDIGRRNIGGWAALRFSHCSRQRKYWLWKIGLLGDLARWFGSTPAKTYRIAGRVAHATRASTMVTRRHPELSDLRDAAYPNGTKSIDRWVERLGVLGLAIWYQDDGTLVDWVSVNGELRCSARFYTCAFSLSGIEKLKRVLYCNFGIKTSHYEMRPKQYVITTGVYQSRRLFSLIAKYVHPSMEYKLPPEYRGRFQEVRPSHTAELFYSPLTKVFLNPLSAGRRGGRRTAYCIDVEGVHNFATEEEIAHNCRDSDSTGRAGPTLLKRVDAAGMGLVRRLDHSVIPIVNDMRAVGIFTDTEYFRRLGEEFHDRMDKLTSQVHDATGEQLNLGSDAQIAHLLFNVLKLKSLRMTKSRARLSVDKKALEALRFVHPVVPLVINYRETETLKTTFCDQLPGFVDEDSRLRSDISLVRVPSGRFAASDPNLLAIPSRTSDGKRLRAGFKAAPGCKLVAWDFHLIEMACEAHESQDTALMEAFFQKIDVHRQTASQFFGLSMENVLPEQRQAGKVIGFGVVNLISALGLLDQMRLNNLAAPEWMPNTIYPAGAVVQCSLEPIRRFRSDLGGLSGPNEPAWFKGESDVTLEDTGAVWQEIGLGWTEDLCQSALDTYFSLHPGVRRLHDETAAEARRFGRVVDMWGRIRLTTEVYSTIPSIREFGVRGACNHKIQAGAAGIMKAGMAAVWPRILSYRAGGKTLNPLLPIHDELLCEVEESIVDVVGPEFQRLLETAVSSWGITMRVPITVKYAVGDTWAETK